MPTPNEFREGCKVFDAFVHYAVKRLGITFDTSAQAPDTWDSLQAHAATHGPRRLLVYDGHSENTVYDGHSSNHAFRAWHDYCHLMGQFDFTLRGEERTAELQDCLLRAWWDDFADEQPAGARYKLPVVQAILLAETAGQARYHARHGRFPVRQEAFAWLHVNDAPLALDTPGL